MKLKCEFIIQELAGNYIAVPVGIDADVSSMLQLNDTGKSIFELLTQQKSEDEIVSTLMEQFEGEEADIRAEVQRFVNELTSKGLME